ncbi:hypothetical protein QOT17_013781 [Balamuthia mandrillaris]
MLFITRQQQQQWRALQWGCTSSARPRAMPLPRRRRSELALCHANTLSPPPAAAIATVGSGRGGRWLAGSAGRGLPCFCHGRKKATTSFRHGAWQEKKRFAGGETRREYASQADLSLKEEEGEPLSLTTVLPGERASPAEKLIRLAEKGQWNAFCTTVLKHEKQGLLFGNGEVNFLLEKALQKNASMEVAHAIAAPILRQQASSDGRTSSLYQPSAQTYYLLALNYAQNDASFSAPSSEQPPQQQEPERERMEPSSARLTQGRLFDKVTEMLDKALAMEGHFSPIQRARLFSVYLMMKDLESALQLASYFKANGHLVTHPTIQELLRLMVNTKLPDDLYLAFEFLNRLESQNEVVVNVKTFALVLGLLQQRKEYDLVLALFEHARNDPAVLTALRTPSKEEKEEKEKEKKEETRADRTEYRPRLERTQSWNEHSEFIVPGLKIASKEQELEEINADEDDDYEDGDESDYDDKLNNEDEEAATQLLDEVNQQQMTSQTVLCIYGAVIRSQASLDRVLDAFDTLKEMKRYNHPPTPELMGALAGALIRNKGLEACFSFLDQLKEEGVSLDSSIFGQIITNCNDDPEQCFLVIQRQLKEGIIPDGAEAVILDRLCKKNRQGAALTLFNKLKELYGPAVHPRLYYTLFRHFASAGEMGRVLELFVELRSTQVMLSTELLVQLIRTTCKEGYPEVALQVVEDNSLRRYVPPRSFSVIARRLTRKGKLDEALRLLYRNVDHFDQTNSKLLDNLLAGLTARRQWEKAVNLVRFVRLSKFLPTSSFLARCQVLLSQLEKQGVKHAADALRHHLPPLREAFRRGSTRELSLKEIRREK